MQYENVDGLNNGGFERTEYAANNAAGVGAEDLGHAEDSAKSVAAMKAKFEKNLLMRPRPQ